MKLIAFYTKNTIYEKIFNEYLKPCLKQFNIVYTVIEIPTQRNWYKNTAQKPLIILEYLEEQKENDTVVYLDVDAKILKYPSLFDEINETYDIGVHYLDWSTWYGYSNNKTKELLTGTMWFRNNQKIRELCKEWYKKAMKTNNWEQKVLQEIISNYNLKIYTLPIEYSYINTLPNGNRPLIKCDPVIIHYQKSRDFKNKPI